MPQTKETRVRSLGQEDPLEEGMATRSSILAWRIPWTEEPDRLQSTVPQSWTQLKLLSTHTGRYQKHCVTSVLMPPGNIEAWLGEPPLSRSSCVGTAALSDLSVHVFPSYQSPGVKILATGEQSECNCKSQAKPGSCSEFTKEVFHHLVLLKICCFPGYI